MLLRLIGYSCDLCRREINFDLFPKHSFGSMPCIHVVTPVNESEKEGICPADLPNVIVEVHPCLSRPTNGRTTAEAQSSVAGHWSAD